MRAFIDFPAGSAAHPPLRAAFDAPQAVLTAWQPHEVAGVLREADAHARAGAWCVGGLAYEAAAAFDPALHTHRPRPGWPLARFLVFEQAQAWDPESATADAPAGAAWQSRVSREAYIDRVELLRRAIGAGECYQVNLAVMQQAALPGDPAAWMARLRAAQPGAYLAWLDWGDQQVLSASPELFFDWQRSSGHIRCRPMKGTAARHPDPHEDARARQTLLDSAKERAENVMVVDLLRNDLGRIAEPGSVQVPGLFDVEAWPTVWQMTSTVTARTAAGCGLQEVFQALFPCGSVTGAPKVRAMQWIRELEDGPRGIYCGAVGVLRPGGDAVFNVPIRTVALERGASGDWRARYGTGSAITWDCDAASEWRELAAKARVTERIVQDFALLETLRLEQGRYTLLLQHLDRMERSAAAFARPWDRMATQAMLDAQAARHPLGCWRVRLTLDASGRLQCSVDALEETATPVPFVLSDRPLQTQGADAEFIMHKTTRRGHYESRLRREPGLFDTLLVNERGELTEFTRGNLALQLEGRWLTPALQCGLLAGTLRGDLLARGALTEAVLLPADLQRAEAVAFYNSLRGWLPARQCV